MKIANQNNDRRARFSISNSQLSIFNSFFPDHLRTIRWSTWLGWQVEANWADPWLFIIYVLAKPLSATLILLFMFVAARAATTSSTSPFWEGGVSDAVFHYIYAGNACYMLVGAVMFGMSWTVIADREHFGMLKYIYISPGRLRSYLFGRGLAKGAEATLGAFLTLLVGRLLLGLPLTWGGVAWGWLLVFLGLGAVMLAALGLLLSGAVLNTARHGYFLSEGVAGTLYLFTGTIFPIAQLPAWLQPVSYVLPPTYWLEGLRRCLLGDEIAQITGPPLADLSKGQLAAGLAIGSAALMLAANAFFTWGERRAWRKGKLDETSGY